LATLSTLCVAAEIQESGEYAAARAKKKEYRLDFVLSKLPAASEQGDAGDEGDAVGR
jgi:hypothetical protein